MLSVTLKLATFHVCCHFDTVSLAATHGGAGLSSANKWSALHLFVRATAHLNCKTIDQEAYRLNGSTKAVALVGAALLLLDFAATAVVSAATASSYLAGEVALSFPPYIGALLVFVLFAAVSLVGLRESARVASGVLAFHVCH